MSYFQAGDSRHGWTKPAIGAAVAAAALLVYGPGLYARFSVRDPSADKRMAYFDEALGSGGVSARTELGQMITLRRGDVGEITGSKCGREYSCAIQSQTRPWCLSIAVTFYCGYYVKDQSGNGATAILVLHPNRLYDRTSDDAKRRDTHRPGDRLDYDAAEEKLCEHGYGCRP